jgi:anti-sigma factor RsiW
MKCARVRDLLPAYLDAELRAPTRLRLRWHLRGCADCGGRLAELEDLRARLRAQLPRYEAPPALRERLRAQWRDAAPPAPGARANDTVRWRWLAGGALAGSAATLVVVLAGSLLAGPWGEDPALAQAVEIHVQASLSGQTVQVASSDRHTVKPWLSARLDYSPPVHDLAQEGFALAGARLETLQGARVATLVYMRRLHTIDVFVRPEPVRSAGAGRTVRGFHVAHASAAGWDFIAVSDLDADALARLVQRLADLSGSP